MSTVPENIETPVCTADKTTLPRWKDLQCSMANSMNFQEMVEAYFHYSEDEQSTCELHLLYKIVDSIFENPGSEDYISKLKYLAKLEDTYSHLPNEKTKKKAIASLIISSQHYYTDKYIWTLLTHNTNLSKSLLESALGAGLLLFLTERTLPKGTALKTLQAFRQYITSFLQKFRDVVFQDLNTIKLSTVDLLKVEAVTAGNSLWNGAKNNNTDTIEKRLILPPSPYEITNTSLPAEDVTSYGDAELQKQLVILGSGVSSAFAVRFATDKSLQELDFQLKSSITRLLNKLGKVRALTSTASIASSGLSMVEVTPLLIGFAVSMSAGYLAETGIFWYDYLKYKEKQSRHLSKFEEHFCKQGNPIRFYRTLEDYTLETQLLATRYLIPINESYSNLISNVNSDIICRLHQLLGFYDVSNLQVDIARDSQLQSLIQGAVHDFVSNNQKQVKEIIDLIHKDLQPLLLYRKAIAEMHLGGRTPLEIGIQEKISGIEMLEELTKAYINEKHLSNAITRDIQNHMNQVINAMKSGSSVELINQHRLNSCGTDLLMAVSPLQQRSIAGLNSKPLTPEPEWKKLEYQYPNRMIFSQRKGVGELLGVPAHSNQNNEAFRWNGSWLRLLLSENQEPEAQKNDTALLNNVVDLTLPITNLSQINNWRKSLSCDHPDLERIDGEKKRQEFNRGLNFLQERLLDDGSGVPLNFFSTFGIHEIEPKNLAESPEDQQASNQAPNLICGRSLISERERCSTWKHKRFKSGASQYLDFYTCQDIFHENGGWQIVITRNSSTGQPVLSRSSYFSKRSPLDPHPQIRKIFHCRNDEETVSATQSLLNYLPGLNQSWSTFRTEFK